MDKPQLIINLKSPDGRIVTVIGYTHLLLNGEQLAKFNAEVRAAIAPDACNSYKDILTIIAKYVRLVDSSGLYPEYALSRSDE